jgi:hypothetical protein
LEKETRARSTRGCDFVFFFFFPSFIPTDNLIVRIRGTEFCGAALRSRHDKGKIFNVDHGATSLSGENSDPIPRKDRNDGAR